VRRDLTPDGADLAEKLLKETFNPDEHVLF
jgi:hypothetical protein